MAEVSTSEAVRDREPDTPAPAPEPITPRATPFDALGSQIQNVYGGVLGARAEQQQGLERKAAAMEPRLTAAQTASDAFAKEIQTHRAELEASRPQITPPPSRNLSTWLSPREGESPEASVTKLIAGMTAFATGLGGLAKGDATAGLAAFTGALKGWHEGDKERADRAFADWKAKTEAALKNWDLERTSYIDWIEAKNLSLDQMLKGAELEGIKHDNAGAVKAFQTGTMEGALSFLQQERNHADSVELRKTQIEAMYEGKRAQLALAEERAAETARHNREIEQARREAVAKKDEDQKAAVDSYPPDVLRSLGQQWILDGKPISIGGVRGPAVLTIRGNAMRAGLEWAKEQGIDAESLPQVRAEVAAAKSALTKLRGVDAVQQASIRRFDGHADALLKLSDEVPRSELPAVNRAILSGEINYQGSPKAAAYVTQAFELGMEFSRVVVGTAQGDASTREEARKTISAALTPEQLKAVVEQLRQNAHRNIESNKASEKMYTDLVATAGGFAKKSTPGATANNDPLGIRR